VLGGVTEDRLVRSERLVDPHLERLLGLVAEEPAVLPDLGQERGDRALQLLPERGVVALEHGPADALLD